MKILFCATIARAMNVLFMSTLSPVASPLTAALGTSHSARPLTAQTDAIHTIQAPIDATLATRAADAAAAERRAHSTHRGDRQPPRRVFRRLVAHRNDNNPSGLIDVPDHEVITAAPNVDTEPRKEPCASRS